MTRECGRCGMELTAGMVTVLSRVYTTRGFDIRYPPCRKSAKRMSNPKLH
jgi:hypothetical protein